MKVQLPLPTEKQIQDSLIGYLRMKGYYVQRLNSGAVRVTNKYGNQHVLRLAAAGSPDLMAFNRVERVVYCEVCKGEHSYQDTKLLFIEVKRSEKHKPTPLQLAKMKELEEHGATCIVAWSIEELQKYV